MTKITLSDIASLTDEQTAIATINANSAAVETASSTFLSRDGTSPNQMEDTLDMNSQRIINLPNPVTVTEPLRLQDLNTFIGGGSISTIPSGGNKGGFLIKSSNTDYATSWANQVVTGGIIGNSYNQATFWPGLADGTIANPTFVVGQNFSSGGGEVDVWNTNNAASTGGFSFINQTGASSKKDLLSVDKNGYTGLGYAAVPGTAAVFLEIKKDSDATKNFYGLTPSTVQIYKGSAGTPATDAQPMLGVCRYEALTTDTEGAQNSPIFSVVYSYNDASNGFSSTTAKYGLGTQSNAGLFIARQFGSGDSVGLWGQAEMNSPHGYRYYFTADQTSNGVSYEIAFAGTTDFTAIGSANNTVGTVFTASGPGTGTGLVYQADMAVTGIVAGCRVKIKTVGTTDFTAIGSPNNTVGTEFLCTAAGTGSGTVTLLVGFFAWAMFGNAVASAGSLGSLVSFESNTTNNSGFNHTWASTQAGLTVSAQGILSAAFDAVSNGSNRVATGLNIRTGSSDFDVGIGAGAGSIHTAFLQDDSSSATILKATGTHTTGIDLSGATVTTPFKSSGFSVDGSGNVLGLTYKVGSSQVVGARATGWTVATGTPSRATYTTSGVTLATLAGVVMALEQDLIAHGLIGT